MTCPPASGTFPARGKSISGLTSTALVPLGSTLRSFLMNVRGSAFGTLISIALPAGMPSARARSREMTASTSPIPIVAYAPTRSRARDCSFLPPTGTSLPSLTPPSLPIVKEIATSPDATLRHSASDLAVGFGVYLRNVDGSTPIRPTCLPATMPCTASTTSTPFTPLAPRTLSTTSAGSVAGPATRMCGVRRSPRGATAFGDTLIRPDAATYRACCSLRGGAAGSSPPRTTRTAMLAARVVTTETPMIVGSVRWLGFPTATLPQGRPAPDLAEVLPSLGRRVTVQIPGGPPSTLDGFASSGQLHPDYSVVTPSHDEINVTVPQR